MAAQLASRKGWWEYDPRANADLETAYSQASSKVELLLAGYVYVVDFQNLLQYRKTDPTRRRRVKRDVLGAASKGVAGIRLETLPKPSANFDQVDCQTSSESSSASDFNLSEALSHLLISDEDDDDSYD